MDLTVRVVTQVHRKKKECFNGISGYINQYYKVL